MIDPGPAEQTMGGFKGRRNAQGRYVALGGGAAPVPTGLSITGAITHGSTLSLTDSEARLGTKDQAAPRYWIFGDEVYIDGAKQDDYEQVEPDGEMPSTSWLEHSTPHPLTLSSSRAYRHNRVSRHFHGVGRCHTGAFTNLQNELVADGVRNAIYASCWMRFGFNPGFGTRIVKYASISGSPDFGGDPHDIDGEEYIGDGSIQGRFGGIFTLTDADGLSDGTYILISRYNSSFAMAGKTLTGATSGATITIEDPLTFQNMAGKTLRSDPQDEPHVVTIGIASRESAEHFVKDETDTTIYDTRGGFANLDREDSAQVDTELYNDTSHPFPRWGKLHFFNDFTGDYVRDRAGRDFKNLRYRSIYETLIDEPDPLIDQSNGLIPTSRASASAPRLTNLGFEPSGNRELGNIDFSELYVDRTARRVIIANAATWDQVTRTEDQRGVTWSETQVDFALNLGAFDDAEDFWVYVMDDFDEPIFADGIPRSEIGA